MQENNWQKIETVFNEAAALPIAEREALVKRRCAGDTELFREIWRLVEDDIKEDEFLREPIFTLGAQVIESEYLETPERLEFSNYKLHKLIGRGGMGAVYLAEDTRLRRSVAIKVLPPALAADGQSLARFRQEARAASALSHPNIAHIYEFGEADGHLFLAMEYVEGRTLRQLIKDQAVTTALALNIAGQVASALAATHERGIVHRDIKPENIIVKDGGLVKILDFGLAKLGEPKAETSAGDGDAVASSSWASQIFTQTGMILGTVGYMSPEQIRGQELGAATDLWSLGVVLFEMLTGKRPFEGETPSDVQAAILKDEPLALSDADSAPDINRIIEKALAKNIAERYGSAREFAEDIERALVTSGSNFRDSRRYFAVAETAESIGKNLSLTTSAAIDTNENLRRKFILSAALILTIGSGWLVFHFATRSESLPGKFARLRAERLTNSGSALRAAVAPDGNALAYVLEESGNRGIFLRRRAASGAFSGEATALVAPSAKMQIRGVSFAPGGEQVYFRAKTSADTAFHLYRVAVAGGEPQKIVEDAQSTPSFSPDGTQMVFLRANSDNSRGDLIIADASGAAERVLYTRQSPEFFSVQAQPAWSPDGTTILCSTGTKIGNRESMLPVSIGVESGQVTPVFTESWSQIWTTQWVENGAAFIMTGRRDGSTDNNQLWLVAYPSGEITQLTDDFNDFYGVSAANQGSGAALASVILNRKAKLWKINLADPSENPRQLTESGGDDGYGVSSARSERIIYGSTAAGNPDIWSMNASGGERRQLTSDLHSDSQPNLTPDGRHVVFASLRSGIDSLWRMNADGSEQKLLVSDTLREPLAIAPDNRVYYHSTTGGAAAMWRVRIDGGGEPEKLVEGKYFPSAVSPDGKFLAASVRPAGAKAYALAVLSIEENTPRVVREFTPVEGAELPNWVRWSPNGELIVYIVTRKGIGNLWAQPLGGGEPRQLTNFASERIYSFDFSPDGRRIVCARGELSGYVVLLTDK